MLDCPPWDAQNYNVLEVESDSEALYSLAILKSTHERCNIIDIMRHIDLVMDGFYLEGAVEYQLRLPS